MKRIMILGAGMLQVPAIRKAKELGLFVIAADRDPGAPGFRYADVCLPVSTLDAEELARRAFVLKPDLVVTSASDAPVYTAARVSRMLGTPCDLSPEDALCATNKAHMRGRLRNFGVPIPSYSVCQSREEFLRAVSSFPGRCVVKPADGAGSRGVLLYTEGAGRSARECYEYSRSFSRSGTVLAEEYLEGPEVSVEGLTQNGVTTVVAVTDKLVTEPPYFVEIGHSQPSSLEPEMLNAVRNVAVSAVKALRIRNGPSHTEVKVTRDGPKVVELAARLGGDFITSRLVPLSTGVDLVGNSIRLAAGFPTDLSPKVRRGAAIRFFTAEDGLVREIRGVEEAEKAEGVEEAVLYKKEGEKVRATESSGTRLGHVIASAETAARAAELCSRAQAMVSIAFENSPEPGEGGESD